MTDPIDIVLTTDYDPSKVLEEVVRDFCETKAYDEFFTNAMNARPDGTPVAHFVSSVIMHMFNPGFVIVGSPVTFTRKDGITLPTSLGTGISAGTDMTSGDLAHLLRDFADKLDSQFDVKGVFNE